MKVKTLFCKKMLPLLVPCLLLCFVCEVTLAYLIAGTGPLVNIFQPAKISCEVIKNETVDANGCVTETNDIRVKNAGDVAIYVRATVTINWVTEDGKVSSLLPDKDSDYTIYFAEDAGWKLHTDGFWYYTRPLDADEETSHLIERCRQTQNAVPQDHFLRIEVFAQAIQASSAQVVEEAWGVDPRSLANGE